MILATVLVATALPVTAQTVIRTTPRVAVAQGMVGSDDPKRAILGVSTSSSGRRDTLGLLVTSVTSGSPADKAGIEEGNRIVSINGISLKLSRDDADDDYMQGVNQNRLVREMRKVKAGDEVSLEVYGGGRSRPVKVKTVAAADLEVSNYARAKMAPREDERAALGLYLTTTGSKRDTAGVFVQQVVDGGPAEKAGIAEGDRIASINGVDLRVPREDAGDWSVSSSRADRMEREVRKLTVGQSVDLVVVSGGRSRPVKVTAVKASELPAGFAYSFRTGPQGGARFFGPNGSGAITIPRGDFKVAPRIRIQRGSSDCDSHFDNFDFDKHFDFDFDNHFDTEKFKDAFKNFDLKFENFDHMFDGMKFDFNNDAKWKLEDSLYELKNLGPKIKAEIRDNMDREMPRKMDELRDLGPKIRAEVDAALRDVRVRKLNDERIVIPSTVKIRRVG